MSKHEIVAEAASVEIGSNKPLNRANLLELAITILDTAFETGEDLILPDDIAKGLGLVAGQPVPDPTYDMLRIELHALRPDSRIFKDVTASTYEHTGAKVRHDPPMTSIAKASHEDRVQQEQMFFKWLAGVIEKAPHRVSQGEFYYLQDKKDESRNRFHCGLIVRYPKDYFYQSYKLDGAALALYYEKGKLVRAGLRPRNGTDGEDVTEQVKYVAGIPQELKLPVTCSIRGELLCLKSDFAKVQRELEEAGEDVRANPRNHAAGGIRQFKDPSKVKKMRLSFIAHSVAGQANPPYQTEIERAIYCSKELGVRHVRVQPFNFWELDEMERMAKDLDYMTDGIVIGVNSLHEQDELGNSGGSATGTPNGKIAWKFAEERAMPVVKSIEWNTGRTGSITPVAIFDDVPLAGTMVGRATLHNLGFMRRKGISIGTRIAVLKAGNIIPKVVGVVSDQMASIKYPEKCPSCGGNTKVQQGDGDMVDLICDNASCPAQNVSNLCHFLDVIGVLGLGESKVSALAESGVVRKRSDFFKLDMGDCLKAGFSERQAALALASVWMIPTPDKVKDNGKLIEKVNVAQKSPLKIPLWQLFAALGIESAGKSCGKALVDHFGSFESIRNASVSQLSQVEDVGEKTAQIVHDYLNAHRDEIDEILLYVEPQLPIQGNLTGKTFCLSGGFPDGKKRWEKEIESRGGKIKGVGKTLTALVQGDDPGADKEEKARKYGVRVMTLSQLQSEFLK